jgi:3-oxoacyl-[acyl-carrier protein] reductase
MEMEERTLKITEIPMLLRGTTAVVYGAGGAIGGAVAKAFAREGAKVFLTGRHAKSLQPIAQEISDTGGQSEVAEGDAFDADWVERHADSIIAQEGHLDISFNVVSVEAPQGTPLINVQLQDLAPPVERYLTTQFITAGAAARRMTHRGSGAILALTANASSEGFAYVGGSASPAPPSRPSVVSWRVRCDHAASASCACARPALRKLREWMKSLKSTRAP